MPGAQIADDLLEGAFGSLAAWMATRTPEGRHAELLEREAMNVRSFGRDQLTAGQSREHVVRRMTSFMIVGLVLLTSAAAAGSATSATFHLVPNPAIVVPAPRQPGLSTAMHFQKVVTHPVLPESRKSCYRLRLRQLLQLGHDYDLAQEEALLICG